MFPNTGCLVIAASGSGGATSDGTNGRWVVLDSCPDFKMLNIAVTEYQGMIRSD